MVVEKTLRYFRLTRLPSPANQISDALEGNGQHIFIACFPKSGSTYLSRGLVFLTGYRRARLYENVYNEQNLYLANLERVRHLNTVTQQHVRATRRNLELFQQFGIKPVVLTRNIYDIVFSLRDHVEKISGNIPFGYLHREYFQMQPAEQHTFLIHNFLPWYFMFLVSWQEASSSMETLWMSYEELFANQKAAFQRVMDFYGLPLEEDNFSQMYARLNNGDIFTRKNVGTAGRGSQLSDAQKEDVLKIARSWQVDSSVMSLIGILP